MKFFGETHINFTGFRNKAFILSAVVIVAGLVSLAIKGGPDLSIDFEGGTLVQVRFDQPVLIGDLRATVEDAGYDVAFTTQSGLCHYPLPRSRMFSIPRISIEGNNRIKINYRIGELLFKRNRINSKLATCVIFGLIAIICIASLFYINNK